ncbi:anti-sigma factor [Nocardia alni]|uniref:anti-sigma factor n=1 Tax=Nocardia alni TaxID=2815723 RepID=UPI001C232DE2|nr:anti-sigma factor [Nocardia alni]
MPDIHPHEDLLDFAHPYALDALSDQDRRAVEHMLDTTDPATAETFRATVRDLRETLALITIVDAVPAPADLEAKLQRALDAQLGAGAPTAPDDTPDEHGPTNIQDKARTRLRWMAAAAAAVVVIAAGAGAIVYSTRSHESTGISAQQVIDHADTRENALPIAGGGTINVSLSHQLNAAAISFATVPAPPANHTYQLWLISPAGQPRSAGVLPTLPTTHAPLLVRFGNSSKLAMTIEPAGGSPAPTTQPIVGVPLT